MAHLVHVLLLQVVVELHAEVLGLALVALLLLGRQRLPALLAAVHLAGPQKHSRDGREPKRSGATLESSHTLVRQGNPLF